MKSRSKYELKTNNATLEKEVAKFQPQKTSNRLSPPDMRKNRHSLIIVDHDATNEIITSNLLRPCLSSGNEIGMKQSTKLKVRTEKSAMVLGSIVILFLFTHSYRMALKLYDVSSPNAHTIEKFKICYTLRR